MQSAFSKINLTYKKNQQLAELRDWLLPMFMNGEVRVGEDVGSSSSNDRRSISRTDKVKYKEPKEELKMVAEDDVKYKKFKVKWVRLS